MKQITNQMERLIPLEFRNQRIMTTKVLAEQFGTNEQNISKNFIRNQSRFIEGKHYFKLDGNDLKNFKGYVLNDESLKYVSVLYLWTDRGASRHAKILDTDKAWDVYEELEENYFNPKDGQVLNASNLSPELQAIFSLDKRTVEIDNRIDSLEDKFENTLTLDHGLARNIQAKVTATVKRLCCGNESYAYLDKQLRRKMFSFVWRSLKDYFNINAYHNLLRKDVDAAMKYLGNLSLQGSLLREVQQANNQMCFGRDS